MVITGVADRAPGRVSALVYCDAYLPADGESCWELAGPEYRQVFAAGASGDGLSVAPPTRLDPRASAHPNIMADAPEEFLEILLGTARALTSSARFDGVRSAGGDRVRGDDVDRAGSPAATR